MAVYQFDTDHAARWGVNEAILLHNLVFWIRTNKAEGRHFHDGRYWTHHSVKGLGQLYPFWKAHQIRYILDSLRKQGVILTGNYSENRWDKTLWFAIVDEKLLDMGDPGEEVSHRVEKIRKSERENPQIEATKLEDRAADTLSSLKGADNRQHIKTQSAADRGPAAAASNPLNVEMRSTGWPASSDLVSDLTSAGLNRSDAERLAVDRPDDCRRQLEYLPFVTEFRSSRGAYLRSAIEGGYGPPAAWEQAQRAAAKTAEKERKQQERAAAAERARAETAEQDRQIEEALWRLEADPDRWREIVTAAEARLPAVLRGRPDRVGYQPALDAKIRQIVEGMAT